MILSKWEMWCVSLKDRQYFEYDALSYACGDSIIETARNNQQVADFLLQDTSPVPVGSNGRPILDASLNRLANDLSEWGECRVQPWHGDIMINLSKRPRTRGQGKVFTLLSSGLVK